MPYGWQTIRQGSSYYFIFLSSHLQMMWQVTPAMIERISEVNISTIILTSFDFSVEASSMTDLLYQKNKKAVCKTACIFWGNPRKCKCVTFGKVTKLKSFVGTRTDRNNPSCYKRSLYTGVYFGH